MTSTPITVNSVTLPSGCWIIFGAINTNGFAGDYTIASISTTNNTLDLTCELTLRWTGTGAQNLTLSRGTLINSTQTFYLVGQASAGVATNSVTMYAIRVG
jgi:hypothetical protein